MTSPRSERVLIPAIIRRRFNTGQIVAFLIGAATLAMLFDVLSLLDLTKVDLLIFAGLFTIVVVLASSDLIISRLPRILVFVLIVATIVSVVIGAMMFFLDRLSSRTSFDVEHIATGAAIFVIVILLPLGLLELLQALDGLPLVSRLQLLGRPRLGLVEQGVSLFENVDKIRHPLIAAFVEEATKRFFNDYTVNDEQREITVPYTTVEGRYWEMTIDKLDETLFASSCRENGDGFWLSRKGAEYLKQQYELVNAGKKIRRLFVVVPADDVRDILFEGLLHTAIGVQVKHVSLDRLRAELRPRISQNLTGHAPHPATFDMVMIYDGPMAERGARKGVKAAAWFTTLDVDGRRLDADLQRVTFSVDEETVKYATERYRYLFDMTDVAFDSRSFYQQQEFVLTQSNADDWFAKRRALINGQLEFDLLGDDKIRRHWRRALATCLEGTSSRSALSVSSGVGGEPPGRS